MNRKSKILRFLKNLFIALLLFLIAFGGYVAIVTQNTKEMTIRQRVLKAVYPAFTWWGRITGTNSKVFTNELPTVPLQSLYDLSVTLNNGDSIPLSNFKGKKLLLVNTASDCGYTDQYDDLQKLYQENKDKLVIIGFPANDFKEQEKGTDEEIAQFCKLNYGVTFPLAKKSTVIPGPDQNPVFQWLTDKNKNGWTSKKPSWNFSKYLINEKGVLINYFDPTISPTGKEVTEAVKK
ncbi:MAG TPA: glutathione peroxidase [Chitinophagaceae bacterium]|nr:glutathione peroxidase [Chitinophagaceae bacterium]